MPNFSPDLANFGDIPGYGQWDIGHAREHIQFVQVLAQQNPAIVIADFNFLSFLTSGQGQRDVLNSHQNAHALLRQITGVQGIDLSQVDLTKPDDFNNWISYHSEEHAVIRQILGIT
jgi:hypothetical protein